MGLADTRSSRALAAAVMLAATAAAAVGTASPAAAGYCDPPINGSFTAVSDGVWAQTNDVYHDEKTVKSTWTVTTTCTAQFPDCAGQVVSSQGWSAPINCEAAGQWFVRRHLEHWEPCQNGTTVAADQLLYFTPDLFNATTYEAVKTFSGWDRTIGPSGGCGTNQPLVIEMPFQLTKTG